MEIDKTEVERFRKKAESYKKALRLVPYSRIFEISAILSIIDGFIEEYDLDKKDLVIVDLMAGNGYLSEFLVRWGFKNVHALEACNEMSFDSNAFRFSGVKLHPFPDISSLQEIFLNLRPDIIVSLASFHHLVIHESNNIDKKKSLELQKSLILECLNSLPDTKLLLIVDIYDSDLLDEKIFPPIKYWCASNLKRILPKELLDNKLIKKICKTNSIVEFSNTLSNLSKYDGLTASPLKWFREIVSKRTSIGHDDFSIKKTLLKNLESSFQVSVNVFKCPWIFKDENEMQNFILNKFGFINDHQRHISNENLFIEAEKILGISKLNKRLTTLGWSLASIMIKRKDILPVSMPKRKIILALISLIVILGANLIFGESFKASNASLTEIANTAVAFLLGLIITEVFNFFLKSNKNKKKE